MRYMLKHKETGKYYSTKYEEDVDSIYDGVMLQRLETAKGFLNIHPEYQIVEINIVETPVA